MPRYVLREPRTTRPSVAIILPAYNEELTVGNVVREFHAALPDAGIYVMNNNSSDNTAGIAAEALRELGCTGAVIDESRQGKGNAVRRAFMDVDADIYVLADADLTYPAARIMDLIEPVKENRADMVVGDRRSGGQYSRENRRPLHDFGNRLVQWLVNTLFNSRLVDIMSGYRAFSRTFVKSYPILVEGFQIETDMTLHALHKRFRIVEIPIEYRDRGHGSCSKLNTLSDGTKVIFTVAQLFRYYRPMLFFGGAALVLSLLGFLAAVPVIEDYVTSHFVYHVPLAVLAAALEIVAVMMVGIGLMLDSIAHQQRMDYERNLLAEPRAGVPRELAGVSAARLSAVPPSRNGHDRRR